MAIILILVAASFTASTLVVSACVLSSRISRDESWEEIYGAEMEAEPEIAFQTAPQSVS